MARRSPRSPDSVQRALRHIEQHLGRPLSLAELAGVAGLSVWRFATVFRQQVGLSPHRYVCRRRVERAQALIRSGMPAATAASEAGFYDQSHLSRHFKNLCGMTPGQYQLMSARAAPAAC
jgi:AraC-like DNA-binding protein